MYAALCPESPGTDSKFQIACEISTRKLLYNGTFSLHNIRAGNTELRYGIFTELLVFSLFSLRFSYTFFLPIKAYITTGVIFQVIAHKKRKLPGIFARAYWQGENWHHAKKKKQYWWSISDTPKKINSQPWRLKLWSAFTPLESPVSRLFLFFTLTFSQFSSSPSSSCLYSSTYRFPLLLHLPPVFFLHIIVAVFVFFCFFLFWTNASLLENCELNVSWLIWQNDNWDEQPDLAQLASLFYCAVLFNCARWATDKNNTTISNKLAKDLEN